MVDPLKDFQSYHKVLIADVVKATRAIAPLNPEAVIAYRASNNEVTSRLNLLSSELLQVSNQLFSYLAGEKKIRCFANAFDVQDRWLSAMEVIDVALESAVCSPIFFLFFSAKATWQRDSSLCDLSKYISDDLDVGFVLGSILRKKCRKETSNSCK
jgi:hypothetical protein